MMRWSVALALAGSILLALPPTVSARCAGSGATFRCDPVIAESLKRRYEANRSRVYRPPTRLTYEGRNYSTGTGANRYRYTYSDSLGNRYRGTIKTFPGGAYRHWGSWQ